METIRATQLLTKNYLVYGAYINNGRATVGIDGLKNVERRLLLSVQKEASTKFVSSAAIVGHCLGSYHPHGETSIYDSLCRLVVRHFIEGHGNFGSYFPESRPAAMRYTKVKAIESLAKNVFPLVPYTDHIENEFGIKEPVSLPVPIPLCLMAGGSCGIGIGLLSVIPSFSPLSLYKSLMNDNPKYLRSPNGLKITSHNLNDLWLLGKSPLTYELNFFQEKNSTDDKIVSVIEGSPTIFFPDLERAFKKELEEETVYIRNESTDKIRLIISRVKGLRKIDDEYVHEKVKRTARKTLFCRIYVSTEQSAVQMGLRDWLKVCWKKYTNTVEAYKKNEISKLEHKKRVCELVPKVYPLLLQGMKTKAIAGRLNETMITIRDIENHPLRMLRKTDFDKDIIRIKSGIRQIQKITAEQLGKSFLSSLADL